MDVGQPLTEPFVIIIDFLLGQLYEVFVLAFGGAEDQRIIFKQGCISLRDYAFLSAHNENDSRLGRKRNVADAAADPGMMLIQLKRDETDMRFTAVIRKGFQNVFVFVDHMQLFGYQRQQRALQRDGKKHHTKYHMEYIALCLCFAYRCHNGKHDGGCAAEACKGNDRDGVAFGAEGQQDG